VLTEAFRYFVENQWIYNNRNVRAIYQMLSPEEQKVYNLSLQNFDWHRYSELFAYGLNKYTFKSPVLTVKERDARYVSVSSIPFDPARDNLKNALMPDLEYVRVSSTVSHYL